MNPVQNNLSGCAALREALYTRRGLLQFMQDEAFATSRALGQNFLVNRNLMEKIINAAALPMEGSVIEIGPGLGHLTWLLIERGLRVIAVEKDRLFAERLPQWITRWEIDPSRLVVIHQDALQTDFAGLAADYAAVDVLGNLPYNVSVPILFHLAYCPFRFRSISVMVQKEVGERILAAAGNKQYGRLSIVLNYLFEIKKIKIVTPGAFFPQPKVESVFLKLTPKEGSEGDFARDYLERVAQIGFLHRRKKIRKNFQGAIVQRRVFDEKWMHAMELEFNLECRAEEWPVEEWVRFASWIEQQIPMN